MRTTTIRLSEGLLELAKKKARERGITFTALVEEGLRTAIEDRPASKQRRVRLPVSSRKGGLLPQVDPAKLSTYVQELEDREYIEKLTRL